MIASAVDLHEEEMIAAEAVVHKEMAEEAVTKMKEVITDAGAS